MFTHRKGMVQVFGTTYRIVQVGPVHQVFRLLDDHFVGSFRYARTLSIIECHLGPELLAEVARQALRASLLAWPRSEHATWILSVRHYCRQILLALRASKPELSRRLA